MIRTDKEDKNKASYNCENCETNTTDNAVLNIEFIRIYCVFQGRFPPFRLQQTLKPYWNEVVNLPMAPLSDLSSKWPINLPIPWDSESMINNLQPIYYLYKSEGEYSELWMPWLYSNIYYLSQNSELPFFSWAWVASMNNRNIFLEKSYSIIQVV